MSNVGGMASTMAARGVDATLAMLESRREPLNGYIALIRQCANAKAYSDGKKVHAHIVSHGHSKSIMLVNSLIQMYGRCGFPEDARSVFDSSSKNDHAWSSMITAYVKNGRRKEAMELYRLTGKGVRNSHVVLVSALGACDDIVEGRSIHDSVRRTGVECDTILSTALLGMYVRCGEVQEARNVFEGMPRKDVVSYTMMISGYAQVGNSNEAIELYKEMDAKGVQPNIQTYASVLSACSDLSFGKSVHERIVSSKIRPDVVLENSLLNMYAKCGDIDEARRIFDRMQTRTTASWNSMITALVRGGFHSEALDVFRRMNTRPNTITFTKVLGACCSPESLSDGKSIHERILSCGPQFQTDEILQNALVTMYGKCGGIDEAERLFRAIRRKNVFSWTTMITAYAQHDREQEAIDLYREMISEGKIEPDPITYGTVLTACSTLGELEEGMRIHSRISSKGISSAMVLTGLIDLYGKWKSLEDALQVYESIEHKDVVARTAIISSCVNHNQYRKALELFRKMEHEGLRGTTVTYSLVLTACSHLGALPEGEAIEAREDCSSLQADDVFQNVRLSLRIRSSSLQSAKEFFDNLMYKSVVSWTAMISAYNQQGLHTEALELYDAMDVEPDDVTFVNVLSACGSLKDLKRGKEIHTRIDSSSFRTSSIVNTVLVDMYIRSGDLEQARAAFESFVGKDVVSWTSLITGYAHHGHPDLGLEFYHRMDLEGVEPTAVTFCSVLGACSRLADLRQGRVVHQRIYASGHDSNYVVLNSLVHMYSKCGRLDVARKIFDTIESKSYPSWRIMLAAYAQHGYPVEALELFNAMNLEGFKFGSPIFSAALIACTAKEDLRLGRAIHDIVTASGFRPDVVLSNVLMNMYAKSGLIEEARAVFDVMPEKNEVSWTTMVSAYSQNGRPGEALEVYKIMDVKPNTLAFVPVITSCGDLAALDEGRKVHERIVEAGFETNDIIVTALVTMYAKCGRLELARSFFDSVFSPDTGAWNSMATAYAQFGHGSQVLELYREMSLYGVRLNGITMLSVLVACSHMGMLEECEHQFECMISDHGIEPSTEHYSCMTDLLGRSGKLEEAEKVVSIVMPGASGFTRHSPVTTSAWMSFLGACKTHNDSERAARAAEKLYQLDPADTAPYILLSQTFSA